MKHSKYITPPPNLSYLNFILYYYVYKSDLVIPSYYFVHRLFTISLYSSPHCNEDLRIDLSPSVPTY